jgi:hypothetical protein
MLAISPQHRANGRINSRGLNRHWMKLQWQIIVAPPPLIKKGQFLNE